MADYDKLIEQLRRLDTERINPDTVDIDRLSAEEIVSRISAEDRKVAEVVAEELPAIAQAAKLYATTLSEGGRVFYLGAGTSGRLGVLDAAECPPTFGTDPAHIVGLISGGYATLVLSQEGVEDDHEAAINDLQHHRLSNKDLVVGLAASVRTPYTMAGLKYAAELGAGTVFIVCNNNIEVPFKVDITVALPVGPEVITGSTRMKSGTAQKMTLNMISTAAMVLLGKTYGNLMVDLQARSEKLAARSRRMLMDLMQIDLTAAHELLEAADGSVKVAIVMEQFHCPKEEAARKLEAANGFITRCR